MIIWDNQTLYGTPTVGVCEISGAYETGRIYRRNDKPIFVGNTKAPTSVEDYKGLLASLGTVTGFKRGYSKRAWVRG